jgi:tRNA dimethylallyltransferase
MNIKSHVIVVVGPTASGKSDFAVELALKCNGEIISADSRQIYKGLDIGTGKITQNEMKGVKHYMLDICTIGEDFSVAEYQRIATPILKDIILRGKTPIICGGTGQYIDSLIFDQKMPGVGPNKILREQLEKKTTEELVSLLSQKDPIRLKAIDKNNRPRVIRALEIIDTLGSVPPQEIPTLTYDTKIYIMNPSRELLRTRIIKRLLKRIEQGMIEEVKKIQSQVKSMYTEASDQQVQMKKFGLEYVTIGKYIDGLLTLDEMKEELITKSMQYAKRQQTWNKKYIPIAEMVEITK